MNKEILKKNGFSRKSAALVLALSLLAGGVIGGTIAWLTAEPEKVTNTFTVGKIDITLTESTDAYKMIPGWIIDKDPVVTVKAGSEDAWVFVVVTEENKLDSYIAYEVDLNNWTKLDGYDNVYYTKATDIEKDRVIKVLGAGTYTDPMGTEDDESDDVTVSWGINHVGVKPSVTEEMMEEAENTQPKLSFKAYAVQLKNGNTTEFTAAKAFEQTEADDAIGSSTGTE